MFINANNWQTMTSVLVNQHKSTFFGQSLSFPSVHFLHMYANANANALGYF